MKEEEEKLMSNVVGGERLKFSQGLHLLPDLRDVEWRIANIFSLGLKSFSSRTHSLTPPNMAKISFYL